MTPVLPEALQNFTESKPSSEDSEDTRTRVAMRKARCQIALANMWLRFCRCLQSFPTKEAFVRRQSEQQPTTCSGHPLHQLCAPSARQNVSSRQRSRTCAFKGTCSLTNRSWLLGVSRRTVKKHDIRWKPVKRLRTAEASATSVLDEMATPLPNKKLVNKKTGKGASFLQQSLREMHTFQFQLF